MEKLCLICARYRLLFTAIILLLNSASVFGEKVTQRIDYIVDLPPNLAVAEGQICGTQLDREDFRLDEEMRWDIAREANKSVTDGSICLHYKARLDLHNEDRYSQRLPKHDFLLTTLNKLLPCPTIANSAADRISRYVLFKLPSAKLISMPGKPSGENRYLLEPRPCSWNSGVLIGDLLKTTIDAFESMISVAMPASLTNDQRNKITEWLTNGIDSLAKSYGSLPVKNFQILVLPTGPNQEAVPWGQVMRGGGDSVHLYVDETKTLQELNDDWVLVHELSHLLHPYLRGDDSWLAEGIASYYQNVLRARSGFLSHDQAWLKLHAGFQRGLKQSETQMTLKNDTRQLMRERKYMRVYWGGAAIALLADVHLRRESDSEMSLDTVLNQISLCCLPTQGKKWRAYDLMRKFDEIANSSIFSSLYEKYVVRAKFPSLDDTYRTLGIKQTDSGLSFSQDSRALHQTIMATP